MGLFDSIKDKVTGESLTPHLDAVRNGRRTDPALAPKSAKSGDCSGVKGRK